MTYTGFKPSGPCPPDGTHIWFTSEFEEGSWTFVLYDGWLVTSVTTTTDQTIADMVKSSLVASVKDRKILR